MSHIGASARTVSRRLGPDGAPGLGAPPSRGRTWVKVAVIGLVVLAVAGTLVTLVAVYAPNQLGSWASAPEQSASPLEPVELDGDSVE